MFPPLPCHTHDQLFPLFSGHTLFYSWAGTWIKAPGNLSLSLSLKKSFFLLYQDILTDWLKKSDWEPGMKDLGGGWLIPSFVEMVALDILHKSSYLCSKGRTILFSGVGGGLDFPSSSIFFFGRKKGSKKKKKKKNALRANFFFFFISFISFHFWV